MYELAKEFKKNSIITQRRAIVEGIKNKPGVTQVVYLGFIYRENIKYLNENGFDVLIYDSPEILVRTGGYVMNIIKVRDDIILTPEEMEDARIFAEKEGKRNSKVQHMPDTFSS